MTIRSKLAGLALALACSAAHAQETDVIALNRQSDAAWGEGRVEEALDLGEAAWRAAEEEWGPVENTALLAQGYANISIMAGQWDRALESSARLVELVESGAAPAVIPTEAALLNALAAAGAGDSRKRDIDALEEALIAAEDGGMLPNYFLWSGWLMVADARYDDRDWDEAYQAGDYVLNLMNLTGAVPDNARVSAAIIAGSSASAQREFEDAYRVLAPALEMVPQYVGEGDERELNRNWAQLAVWTYSVGTAIESISDLDLPLVDDVYGIGYGGPDAEIPEDACALEWAERKPGYYPSAALRRGMIGVVILEYQINAEGRTEAIEIVAANSEEYFGRAATRAIESWIADPATIDNCVGERFVTTITFQIAN